MNASNKTYIDQIQTQLAYLRWMQFCNDVLNAKKNRYIIYDLLRPLIHLRFNGTKTYVWYKGHKYYEIRIMDTLLTLHLVTPIYRNTIRQPIGSSWSVHGNNAPLKSICTVKISNLGEQYINLLHRKGNIRRKHFHKALQHYTQVSQSVHRSNDHVSLLDAIGIFIMIIGGVLFFLAIIKSLFSLLTLGFLFFAIPMTIMVENQDKVLREDNKEINKRAKAPQHTIYEESLKTFIEFLMNSSQWSQVVKDNRNNLHFIEDFKYKISSKYPDNENGWL